MRSMTGLLAATILLAAPAASAAQSVDVGIKAGVLFSDIPKMTEGFKDEGAVNLRPRIGALGGAFVTIHLSDVFAFQVEGLYAQKGMHGEDPDNNDPFEFRLDYVDVPLLLRVQASRDSGAYLLAGPSLNVNVRAKSFEESAGESDIKDDIERSEVGFVVAGGYQISNVLVEGRFVEGLTNVVKDADKYKTRSFAVVLGIRFR